PRTPLWPARFAACSPDRAHRTGNANPDPPRRRQRLPSTPATGPTHQPSSCRHLHNPPRRGGLGGVRLVSTTLRPTQRHLIHAPRGGQLATLVRTRRIGQCDRQQFQVRQFLAVTAVNWGSVTHGSFPSTRCFG